MARDTSPLPAGAPDRSPAWFDHVQPAKLRAATADPAPADPGPPQPAGRPASWRRSRRTWALVGVIALALAALAVWRIPDRGPAPLTQTDVNRTVQSALDQAKKEQRNAPPDAATAYRTILPSLVTVTSERPATGGPAAGPRTRAVLGAGVVINARGAILTALHVVEPGGSIQVRFADGTQASARLVVRQPANDIAVLLTDRLPQVVVPAVMGGGAQVGDAVFPVGNPLGLEDSLTAGVVSAVDRSVRTPDGRTLTGLIQFDAAVNSGNSGGPLLNRDGQVIGIVTGLVNPSRQSYFVGVGFAVPIGTAGGAAGGPRQ